MNGPYDDIIALPRPVSPTRARMPRANRAAQFSSFAALTGFEASIDETARLTDPRIELGESDMDILNAKLQILSDRIAERPEVAVTYFLPDEKKDGGAYVTARGPLRRIADAEKTLVFADGTTIMMGDILDIELRPDTGDPY